MKSDDFSWNKSADTTNILNECERYGTFAGLDNKDSNTLRLLSEEMFGMARSILHGHDADYEGVFSIESNAKDFTLKLTVKAFISETSRENFMSASKDGTNTKEKSVLGKLRGMFERMIFSYKGDDLSLGYVYGGDDIYTATTWSLLLRDPYEYSGEASPGKDAEEWDGMEKNILINIADDVIVGVTVNGAEMTVRKNFA